MKSVQDEALAYALLRFAIGVNFFGHGFVRIIGGVGKFATNMTKEFEKTELPLWMVQPFLTRWPDEPEKALNFYRSFHSERYR
jgi:hypothetical protein